MEVADAVGAVVGRGVPLGVTDMDPAEAVGGADAERAKLIEREDAAGKAVHNVLDTVELGVALRIR